MWCQYDTVHILKTGTPKIITVMVQIKNSLHGFNNASMRPKDVDGMANNVGPDQTAPLWSCLIWASTVCKDLSIQKLTFFTAVTEHGSIIKTSVEQSDKAGE